MGSKMARSPSPPSEPPAAAPPPPPLHDSQELQINAILQGVAAENNALAIQPARPPKRKRKTSEKPPPPVLPPPPPPPPQPSRKELADIRKHNMDVRAEVFKAIRRPGRDFSKLFEHLKQLKGGVDIKKEVLRDVISESLRFKRKALAKLLEDFLAGLEKNGSSAVGLKRMSNALYSSANNNHS